MISEIGVWTVYGWIGWAIVAGLQLAAWYVTGLIGSKLFIRLRRIYHYSVLGYWLDRLEREGKRTFQRPD